MNITNKRTEIIINSLNNRFDFMDAMEYGEPGYDNPEQSILLTNWNDIPDRLMEYLEQAGYALEWSDEWIIDYSSGKCHRSSPDSYFWKPAYILNDWTNGEVIGIADIESDNDLADEYINDYLLNDHNQVSAANIDNHLERLGYKKVDLDYESGLHTGMNDNPEEILKYWNDKGYDLVFSGYESSQFYITFHAYIKPVDDCEVVA